MAKHNFESTKVSFIGGGNMARAIGASLIRKGIFNPNNVWVSARTDKTLDLWKDLGANTTLTRGVLLQVGLS
ncbi:pyrroline-5-carboxylate reductase 3-like [Lasioglossum baleicum]|uniref:pyrroline-5-carboxylate reductase 3-like n=1 Tax=Lasioglossum baleicum TaxID=434251 RepID=UPI003FCDAD87